MPSPPASGVYFERNSPLEVGESRFIFLGLIICLFTSRQRLLNRRGLSGSFGEIINQLSGLMGRFGNNMIDLIGM